MSTGGTESSRGFLNGGGEMGRVIRDTDWARTPLGPVDGWPQSLRTAVSILLDSHFGMYIAWGRDYVQFYNDAYRPILGATKHPAVGKLARETFPESWHIIGPLFDKAMAGTAVGSDDWMLPLDRNGYLEECFFTFSYSPIRDESGGVGGVLVTVTETTSRVLGERRLRTVKDLAARTSAHVDEEDVWTAALDALGANPADLPVALLYAFDPDGSAARLAGAAGAAPGSPAAPARVEMAGDGAPVWPFARAVAGESVILSDVLARAGVLAGTTWPEPVHTAVVAPIARPNVERPYGALVVGISPRRALDTPYREFLSLCADQIATALTNARLHAHERRRAEALAELDRAKTAFFSNISHEFRTPLTLMLGPIADLLEAPSVPDALRGELQLLDRNTQRLLKLVNALLDFSRLEARRLEATFEPTDLPHLTAELASVFRSATERAGLTLTVACPPLPEPIYVDREMWEKIVLNLLSNAFKFTFSGGIDVRLGWRDGAAELTVADTGVGIPSDELPRVFDRFHRGRRQRARSQEGSGIGLALAQELVRMHGGAITVESEVGRGTAFTIRLPGGTAHLDPQRIAPPRPPVSAGVAAVAFVEEALRWLPEAPVAAGVAGAARDPRERGGVSGRRTILLVDDNADMRDYLAALLGDEWNVEAVGDGRSALERARARPPHLVLTDVMMPELDGFELLRALRGDPRLAPVPVIMLSARAGAEARIEGLQAGVDDYVTKPFTARELVARVRAQLAIADARRAADRERRQLYELFMQAPIPIAVVRGPELTFEMANAQYEKVIGRTGLAGRRVFDALADVRGQGYDELLLRVLERGEAQVKEESPLWIDRQGTGTLEETYFTFIYAPMRGADGGVDRVMVLCSDVTDQVRARRDLESAWRHARDEAQLRETVTANATLALFMVDAGNRCTYMNAAAERMTGYAFAEIQGRNLHEMIHHLRPDGRPYPMEECPIDRALPRRLLERGEDVFVHRSGRFFPVAFTASPIVEAGGRPVGTVVEVRDLTDEKRAEAERAELLRREHEARQQAEAASRAKDEFLAMLGHELRNPLSPIVTALQLMRLKDAGALARERTIVERQVQHLIRLVDDLLDVSRITRGKVELRRRVVAVADVAAKAIEIASPLLEARQQRLRVDIDPALRVDADETRFAQVLANLLTNAAKYSDIGTEVVVRAGLEEGRVAVRVRDEGIGIPAELLPRLFDLFIQGPQRPDRPAGGLGLGLSIVKSLTELHGGTVEAASAGPGCGSEFILRFPPAPDEARAPRAPEDATAGADRPAGFEILVVDDNRDAADLMAESLAALGYVPIVAYDAPGALALAESHAPRAALLDIGLPVMDGYELAQRLRAMPGRGHLTLIAVTGYGQQGDRHRSEQAGFMAHLVKPVQTADLVAALHAAGAQAVPAPAEPRS